MAINILQRAIANHHNRPLCSARFSGNSVMTPKQRSTRIMNPIDMLIESVLTAEVPPKLEHLFAIDTKSELIKYAKTIEVTQDELFDLIYGSKKIGYGHFRRHKEVIPDHLQFTEEDKKHQWETDQGGQFTDKTRKLAKKVNEIFNQRKYQIAHLFVGLNKWHILYYDARDIEGKHWIQGSHIHFVNHLFSNADIDDVTLSFYTVDINLGKRIHIKYVEPVK